MKRYERSLLLTWPKGQVPVSVTLRARLARARCSLYFRPASTDVVQEHQFQKS
jgi:hypothetical protein